MSRPYLAVDFRYVLISMRERESERARERRVLTWGWILGISSLVCEWVRVCRVLTWRWILGMSSLICE